MNNLLYRATIFCFRHKKISKCMVCQCNPVDLGSYENPIQCTSGVHPVQSSVKRSCPLEVTLC